MGENEAESEENSEPTHQVNQDESPNSSLDGVKIKIQKLKHLRFKNADIDPPENLSHEWVPDKIVVVVFPDTVSEEIAVVVHSDNTLVADFAVVNSLQLSDSALYAYFRLVIWTLRKVLHLVVRVETGFVLRSITFYKISEVTQNGWNVQ